MQYRNIGTLTDGEIRELLDFTIKPERICKIVRNRQQHELIVTVETKWCNGGESITITDDVCFAEPGWLCENGCIFCEWPLDEQALWLYQQFCIAKGCHRLLYRNRFIKRR